MEDSRIGIRQEPLEVNSGIRAATRRVSRLSSPKAIGDCYRIAIAEAIGATLVTFDRGLAESCRKAGQSVALLD